MSEELVGQREYFSAGYKHAVTMITASFMKESKQWDKYMPLTVIEDILKQYK